MVILFLKINALFISWALNKLNVVDDISLVNENIGRFNKIPSLYKITKTCNFFPYLIQPCPKSNKIGLYKLILR